MDLFTNFSSKENLKKAYQYVQYELVRSTLTASPVDRPPITAIDTFGEQFFVALEQYIRDGKYHPERGFFIYIPKDNLGLRPVCILSMIDRIVYQAIFNQNILGYKIDGQLSDNICFANRVNDNEGAENFLSYYFNNWNNFCRAQKKAFEEGFIWKLELDVQQYYEHIPISNLLDKLKNNFGVQDKKILGLLKEQLCAWVEYPELPKGIPQGLNPSAVLANVYLSSLDEYVVNELAKQNIRYVRYADDIVLMGKNKKDILKATEDIEYFLRSLNLNLNEKTQLAKLQNTEAIEAMRIATDYDNNTAVITEDEVSRIKKNIPNILKRILKNEKVDKLELREFKFYLGVGTEYDINFVLNLINAIPLYPSLVVPTIKYISVARKMLNTFFGDSKKVVLIDKALWSAYNNIEISAWSKFWILKLLASSDGVLVEGLGDEIKRILSSKRSTILKAVCLYYEETHKSKIEIKTIQNAVKGSETNVEKSLYLFFLHTILDNKQIPTALNCIEEALNSESAEINLIGCFLYRNNLNVATGSIDGLFSSYILNLNRVKKQEKITKQEQKLISDYFLIKKDDLIPAPALTSIFGINRITHTKHTIKLEFPEIVQFEKVKLKMKQGLQEMEIFYNGKHIKTSDYKLFGFYSGKKNQKPDRCWGFLCALSVLSGTDIKQATANNMRAMVAVNSKSSLTTANVHQIKRTLVKRFRSLFETDDSPFFDNKDYYHPKFTILPEAELRREDIWHQGGRLDENRPIQEI